ncbi:MAG: YebC/PmpR family DNA-binding transcriptional regulator [Negativicutes bacterium]|nr:YebC/PmpR family DNA-binding transcriptional regulator [Negativicutes bacterium]MBP9948745.1 YebC/PmpR family DNA-binding transcriptional regulator [Negativicutes bacterium]
MSGHSKWANIKHKKGKMDAVRGKITTKIAREITVAVRLGGSDPTGNMKLKLALTKAKANNIPKENIQRAIQKGLGAADGSNYEELVYEGYGPGGSAVLLNVMTDNRNRSAADVRHIFSKNGGNLGESGCVGWMFKNKALFVLGKEDNDIAEDELMMLALEAGAEDFKVEEDYFEITGEPESFEAIQEILEQHNLNPEVAELTMIPDTTIKLEGVDAQKMLKLIDALEDHDDVQNVYANYDIDELE